MPATLPRSYLFVPGNRPERFAKACASGADMVIIDLEDAVAPIDKDSARNALSAWLSDERQVLIRVNSVDTTWFKHDLALCTLPGVAGVILPKAERVEDIDTLKRAGVTTIIPLIETATGFQNVHALASSAGVQRLMFGSIDFQLDLGISGERDALLYFRSQLVLVSRLTGILSPVDGVTTAIDDEAVLTDDTRYAKALGFGAKLCIHPRQVGIVNTCFTPSAAEIEWAERVLSTVSHQTGAVSVDGTMVDKPVIIKAQRILQRAGRGAIK